MEPPFPSASEGDATLAEAPRRLVRWMVVAEALILGWSAVAPGYRYLFTEGSGAGPVALLVLDDPGLFETVAVNVVALHVVLVAAGVGLWLGAKVGSR